MFKSLHNKRFLSLAALSAALCSMTLVAAPVGAQTAGNDEPNHVVVGSIDDQANRVPDVELIEPFTTEELEDLVSPVALYTEAQRAIVHPS